MIFLLFKQKSPFVSKHDNANKASWAIIEIIIFCSFSEIKRIYYKQTDTEHINEIICVAQTKRGEFKIFDIKLIVNISRELLSF